MRARLALRGDSPGETVPPERLDQVRALVREVEQTLRDIRRSTGQPETRTEQEGS